VLYAFDACRGLQLCVDFCGFRIVASTSRIPAFLFLSVCQMLLVQLHCNCTRMADLRQQH
jgi:hypothetical protein